MNRYAQFLLRLKEYGEFECLVTDFGRSYTYARLLDEYDAWLRRLDEIGVVPGTVVGLSGDYSLSSISVLLALFAKRAIVPLIPREGDIATLLDDARVSLHLQFDEKGVDHWQRRAPQPDHELLSKLRSEGDGGLVLFTSGSTGRPKAALQSVERLLHKFTKPGRRYRTLAFLMFDHIAGVDTLLYTLSSGGSIVTTRSRRPDIVCRLIEEAQVEVLPTSPSFLRLMCLTDDASERDLRSLKIITYGSEPMDPSTLALVNSRFAGAVQIMQKYGTTETGSPRSKSRGNDSLWLRIKDANVATRVVDGVLYLRSEGTILGYLNAPAALSDDGWCCTGDLVDVETDDEGEWIRFRGRASETINVGGEKVSPSEVEQVILELPFVKDAVVTGERHVMLGQIVTARVTVMHLLDRRKAAAEIRKRCRLRLAAYKVPVKIDIVEGGLIGERQKRNV